MKAKTKIGTFPILIMGLILALTHSCKKDTGPSDKITDEDGNGYTYVTIGTQVWMKENLKITKYNDGTAIPLVTDNTAWTNLTAPGYCWYDNNEASYKNTYGALYNWYAVNTGKLCPAGWHVPDKNDWTTLGTFLGGVNIAGGKLKEAGITHWTTPNAGATNETGFTALPGGLRDYNGAYMFVGINGFWWSSTEYSSTNALNWDMEFQFTGLFWNYNIKSYGFSVRCLKD